MLSLRSVNGQNGVFFEDLGSARSSPRPGRTVTEADIVIFAGLSGDYNVLHTDAEHMKSSIFGERIAHGLLGLGIQQGLPARAGTARAPAPDRAQVEVQGADQDRRYRARALAHHRQEGRRAPGWGVVTVERRLVNQRGEVVQEGETDHLVDRRPA